MPYEIRITPRAARDIEKLPRPVQDSVLDKLEELGIDPRPPGCQKVKGLEQYDVFRLRVAGSYRIVYQVRDEAAWVLALKVADRKEIYRRLDDLRRLLEPPLPRNH